jgi:hypothetical protein
VLSRHVQTTADPVIMVCPRAKMAKDFTEHVRVAKSKSTTVASLQPVARRGKSPGVVCFEHAHPLGPLEHTRLRDLHGVLSHGARVAGG